MYGALNSPNWLSDRSTRCAKQERERERERERVEEGDIDRELMGEKKKRERERVGEGRRMREGWS